MTKTFKDNLVLEEDKTFEESIKVQGNIRGKDVEKFNLTIKGNINARYINARDIDAWDIDARSIDAWNIDAWNIDAENIDAENISFYAFCISYRSLKCRSIEGIRDNSLYECLDSEIEFKEERETCECCGQKNK